MILNSPENRKTVAAYLESLNEDKFIDEFVIPYFSSYGFYLYRSVDHSSGEHGKDLIFYRHIPMYYDNEYIVIQAKSEKLTTRNVEKFSSQIKRALKVPFTSKSGGSKLRAHYAIFINSKRHTNDANDEFHEMVVEYPYVKILSQENVCELILKSGVGPKRLLQKLSKSTPDDSSQEDRLVYETILGNVPSDIDNLLDHKLKFIKQFVSDRSKELVIDYIYDRWQLDRSWEGTVKPMKWFDTYFDFFTKKQYVYLIDILEELTSTNPSSKALSHTSSVVRKITPEILSSIAKPFTLFCAKMVLSTHSEYKSQILKKLENLKTSGLVTDLGLKKMMEKTLDFGRGHYDDDSEYETQRKEIQAFAYPELAEMLKQRRKRIKPNKRLHKDRS